MQYVYIYIAIGVVVALWRTKKVLVAMRQMSQATGHELGGVGFVLSMSIIAAFWPVYMTKCVVRFWERR